MYAITIFDRLALPNIFRDEVSELAKLVYTQSFELFFHGTRRVFFGSNNGSDCLHCPFRINCSNSHEEVIGSQDA